MKILHIIPSYLPAHRASGPIYPTHFLNRQLVKMGMSVTVCTTDLDGSERMPVPFNESVKIDGVEVRYFPSSFPMRWYYSPALAGFLKDHLAEFDVVHITSVFLSVSTIGAHYAKKFSVPYVISPHGSLMKIPLTRGKIKKSIYLSLVERKNLRDAAAIHFTAAVEENEYRDAGFPVSRAVVIPNGFNSENFSLPPRTKEFRERIGVPNDAKILLFLGRISWKKGFDTLIPALREVLKVEPKAVLVIAGGDDEGYRKAVEKMVSREGVSPNVRFVGELLGEDKFKILSESDVFVLPSYSENFGMAVVEALYAKLPIVISPEVAIARDVLKWNAGRVVEKKVSSIANAIIETFHNPVATDEMRARGKKLVEESYSCAHIAKEFLRVYREVSERNDHE